MAGDGFLHYTSSDTAGMEEWTNEEVQDVFAHLAEQWQRVQRVRARE